MCNLDFISFLLKYWYRPVHSMRSLLDAGRGHFTALMIVALFGIVQSSRILFFQTELIFLHFFVGGVVSILCLYLYGWLVCNFGRWFGAAATQRDVRIALGISILPWTLVFVAIKLLLNVGFSNETIAGYVSVIAIIFVYNCVILLLSLSVVLQMSVIKTFVCLVVTVLFSLFPLTLLAQILTGLIR